MFERAARLKLRFTTSKGTQSIEDLWDLPLESPKGASLEDIAKDLNRQVKESVEESFVKAPSTANAELVLKFEIVKYIIKVRMEEATAKKLKSGNKAKRERVLAVLASKQEQGLAELSEPELIALAKELA